MKIILLPLLSFGLAAALTAQAPEQNVSEKRTADYLANLLAPVALYPDPLVALILPAATVPAEVVLASRYARADGDPARIDSQPWDSSVKALARYPDIVNWMDENLQWTTEVGAAYVEQAADVLDAIQQLRARANEAGNLVDTPQQKVVVDNADIQILPANPEVIYIPRYDPGSVYVKGPPRGAPLFTFGPALPAGSWLHYGLDWRRRGLFLGDWHAGAVSIANGRPWQPDPNRVRLPKGPTSVPGKAPPSNAGMGLPKNNPLVPAPFAPVKVAPPFPGNGLPPPASAKGAVPASGKAGTAPVPTPAPDGGVGKGGPPSSGPGPGPGKKKPPPGPNNP